MDSEPSMADQSKIIFESKKASSKTLARVIHQCLTITAAEVAAKALSVDECYDVAPLKRLGTLGMLKLNTNLPLKKAFLSETQVDKLVT